MIHTILSLLFLALIAVLAAWLADRPGDVLIDWPGYRIELSVSTSVIVILVLMAVSALFYSAWRWLKRGPSRISNARASERQRRGYRALTLGMTAVAAGNADQAARQARRAESLLDDAPLTYLLSAQAAQLANNENAAKVHFTSMLSRPETELLGVRGLLAHARRVGDHKTALAYARRALRIDPGVPWVSLTSFELESRAGNWAASETALAAAVKSGAITASQARRRKAIACLGIALEAETAGRASQALDHALEAHKLDNALVPAALLAVRVAQSLGKNRKADNVILTTWAIAPHPELVAAYRNLRADEGLLERFRRIEKLVEVNPVAVESRIALAQGALEVQEFVAARNQLEPLIETGDSRVFDLMANLEGSEEDGQEAARLWRNRAEQATEPAWHCSACWASSHEWRAYCQSCERFDTIEWLTVTDSESTRSNSKNAVSSNVREVGFVTLDAEIP